jgi:hyperosmotically inducible periplasmic protein
MKYFILGIVCALVCGCSQNNPRASDANSTTEGATSRTVNRPITNEEPAATTEPIDRTNTGINVRDRENTAITPMDQNENKADIALTADIRKRIVETTMSVDAHNVKIITQDGKVTLRGPVNTQEEKQRIEEIAKDVAGADKVDSQLEVNNK